MDWLFNKIDFTNLNVLMLLGLALFGGLFGAIIFKRLKIPQVVGYILIGLILGTSGLDLISLDIIKKLEPINSFALGLIGFTMGNELRLSIFKKYGKQFMYILFFEALTAAFIVGITIFFGASFFYKWKTAIVFAMLLGPISAATAAAGTTDVINEYKAKGIVTTTLMGIIALDDVLALFLFAIFSAIASNFVGTEHVSLLENIIEPTYEILGSVVIGSIAGYIFGILINKSKHQEGILELTLGGILIVLGLSVFLNVDMIMSSMIMGTIFANMSPKKSKEIFNLIEKFAPPIYVLFFVFVGAKFNISNISKITILFIFLFLIGRSLGKAIGAYLGAKFGKAPEKVKKYLPFTLLSQSGVAIGLSIIASQKFTGQIGETILITVTATTFIVQIIGPIFIKKGLELAGELYKNVSLDDLKKKITLGEINVKITPVYLNDSLDNIIKAFSTSDTIYLPVIDDKKSIVGIIDIETIKELISHSNSLKFLVAMDIMDEVELVLQKNNTIADFLESTTEQNVDYAVVVDENNKLYSLLDLPTVNKFLNQKYMQHKAEVEF